MEPEATNKFEMWVIGEPCNRFQGDKLPSNLEVLSRFAYAHRVDKKTIHESASITMKELTSLWGEARITTRKPYNVINQIEKYYASYLNLKKHRNDITSKQNEKQKAFQVSLYNIFDVAHADASQLDSKKDVKFLDFQRQPGREGLIKRNVNSTLGQNENVKKLAHSEGSVSNQENVIDDDSVLDSYDDISDIDTSSEEEYIVPQKKPKGSASVSVLSTELASVLDRYKVSDEAAFAILAVTLHKLGYDVDQAALSVSTIRRYRIKNRTEIYNEVKSSFSPNSLLTIHWDEKKMRNADNNKNVGKLVAVVSSGKTTKLLDAREIPNGNGKTKAESLVDITDDWEISQNIHFMCFDTTKSNSGNKKGACTILQKLLDKYLISLACRHHILELVIGAVFHEKLEEVTQGPKIQLFEDFSQKFVELNKSNFESGISDPFIHKLFRHDKNNLIQFINEQITILKQAKGGRGDYIEFLELGLIFLGETASKYLDRKISIHKPSGYSRARWMAVVIYCLKMFLFRNHLNLEPNLLLNLRDTCVFIVKIYLKNWVLCQLPTTAATNDLQMLKDLRKYKSINETIANVSFEKLSSHTWYLSEVVVAFSFFNDELDVATKRRMVENLFKKMGTCGDVRLPKINEKTILKSRIEDFVTQKSQYFFEIFYGKDFMATKTFLSTCPSTWNLDSQYVAGKDFVKNLLIVNDVAERYIALAASFNEPLVKAKDQKKYLLHVVEDNRQRFPKNTSKGEYIKSLKF